jgi:hypothetical protein
MLAIKARLRHGRRLETRARAHCFFNNKQALVQLSRRRYKIQYWRLGCAFLGVPPPFRYLISSVHIRRAFPVFFSYKLLKIVAGYGTFCT